MRFQREAGEIPENGIVHFGPGAFFRAFGAIYTAEAMELSGGDWGTIGVSLRSTTVRDALVPQGCAYTAVTLAPDEPKDRQVGSVTALLCARDGPAEVVAAMVDPKIKIVSLTITEKGYCHTPATGALDPEHPDILHDLATPQTPRSAIGFIVAALRKRRALGHAPFTVLSCDNLPDNGALVRGVVLDFAQRLDPTLAQWIAQRGRFPATMVDRITPATTPQDIAALEARTGYHDAGCVVHEPFRQWVIEDDFVAGDRPDWGAAGALLVSDVAPYEAMKLRCLNGTHSSLAYLGYLSGHKTVAEAAADPVFAELLNRLWRKEIVPTLEKPAGVDLMEYCDALLLRYRNPAVRHLTWQIAMDGSLKLPQRLLGTILDNRKAGRAAPLLTLSVAGWMRYVGGIDERGDAIDVRDPLAKDLRSISDASKTPSETVGGLLEVAGIFDADLREDATFRSDLICAYEALVRLGARASVEAALSG